MCNKVVEVIRKDLYLARLRKLPDEYGPVRIDVKHFWPSYFNREFVFRRTYAITKYFQFFFDKKTKNLKIQIFWIRETLEKRSRNGSWTRVWRPKTTSIFERMRCLHYACFSTEKNGHTCSFLSRLRRGWIGPYLDLLCLCLTRSGRHPKFFVFENSGGRI